MDSDGKISLRMDLIARALCLLFGVLFSIGALLSYSANEFSVLFLVLFILAMINIMAGTVGPRSLRIAIVSVFPFQLLS
jgi:hypothetical protein